MEENKLKDKTGDELIYIAGRLHGSESAETTHAELLRRNTEALIESKKSADYYADRMMGLSLIVGLIAFLQLLFQIFFASITPIEKTVCGVGAIALVVYAFRDYFMHKEN